MNLSQAQRYSRMRDVATDVDRIANEYGIPVDFIVEFVEILVSKGQSYQSAVERVDELLAQARFKVNEAGGV